MISIRLKLKLSFTKLGEYNIRFLHILIINLGEKTLEMLGLFFQLLTLLQINQICIQQQRQNSLNCMNIRNRNPEMFNWKINLIQKNMKVRDQRLIRDQNGAIEWAKVCIAHEKRFGAYFNIYLLFLPNNIKLCLNSVNQMEPLLSNLVKSEEGTGAGLLLLSQHQGGLLDHPRHSDLDHAQSTKDFPVELTANQQYTLCSQILAYKHLVRNIPVPPHDSFAIQGSLWHHHTLKNQQTSIDNLTRKTEKDQELKNMIVSSLKNSHKDQTAQNDQLKFLIDKRRNEIEHILEKGDDISPSTREKLMLESKFLAVKDLYKSVFQKLSEGMKREHKSLTLYHSTLLDRNFFRRERLSKGDGGSRTEKSGHMKSDNDRRKRMMHRECMQQLKIHKEQFLEWHRKKIKDRRKLALQVKTSIESRRKEKEEQEERRKIARLKELKAQNMEIYLQLVEEEKKSKIRELLSQTNRFLKELGAKVLVQKGAAKQEGTQGAAEGAEENLKDIFQSSNAVYYNLTHTIKEQVTVQPTMLEGGELKKYQLHGLQWLVSLYNNNLNGILADEMGLGKTIQTISLLSYLIQYKKNYGPFLIVAPLSTIPNWMAQFEKWAPAIRKVVYKGNPNTRTETLKIMRTSKWNVCITTYDFILKDRLKLNKYDWKYIVIDEGHKMKNAKSKFSNILGQQYTSDHRLLLTGTPLQNNLGELWALLNFLLPKVFNSCDDFQKWFSMAIYKNTGDQSVQLDEEEQLLIINRLHQVLRPFLLRRVKKEVYSQLPDKKQHVIKVELSGWQKLIYENISRKTALQFANNSGKISKTTLTNLMMQLRKCCNHPYLFLRNYDDISYHQWIIRSSGKFELIDRILPKLKRFGHRILIFTQMTHLMDIMQAYFDYRGVRHLRLDGSTKSEDREQRMKLFNEPNSQFDVFLLSTRAGGLGLNLQTADTVIIFDSDWNPQMDLQAQDRVHRIGQQKEVIVLRLITNNSIEEHILERTAFKMNLNELFIQGGLYNLNSSEAQRRKKIQDILLKRRKENDENEQDQILDDDMINQYLKRSQQEYEEFTRMDQQRYQLEKDYYNISGQSKKNYNYRLMKEDEIPSWFIETPRSLEINKEYGRGNRVRKQINYSDEVIDDQVLNFNELQDEQNAGNQQNYYSAVEVPKAKKQFKQVKQTKQKIIRDNVDIDQIITKVKGKIQEEIFEDDL